MKSLTLKEGFRKMVYLIFPIIAGVAIALQTALSGKVSTQVGALETVILVHFFGLMLAILVFFLRGNVNFTFLSNVNLLSVIAGSLGVVIIFTISRSFVVNGALTTVLISVIIQLIVSKFIDHFGLLGAVKNPVNLMQVFALLIIVSGIVMFQYSK